MSAFTRRFTTYKMESHHITLFTETNTSPNTIRESDSVTFQHVSVTRNQSNETLMTACQNGYVIRCSPPPEHSIANAETSMYVIVALLAVVVFALIGIAVLFLAKKIRDKDTTIKDLQRKLSQKGENYGKLENDA